MSITQKKLGQFDNTCTNYVFEFQRKKQEIINQQSFERSQIGSFKPTLETQEPQKKYQIC